MSRNFAPSKYTLDISRPGHTPKKFKCPQCREKRFVKFMDTSTGIYLDEQFGRCDRQEQCGYYRNPYAIAQPGATPAAGYIPPPKALPPIKIVERATVAATLKAYDQNNFTIWLATTLGTSHTAAALKRFFIGTAKGGSTIFWQLDRSLRARTGAKILYNPTTGKRDRSVPPTRLFTKGDGYQPCIFGEHQFYTVSDSLPVALVESEKSAIICTAYLPTISGEPVLWMATSGANGLDAEKMKVLAGKDVILCPDFSFHARATWGLVPMRKKANLSNVLVIDPAGEVQEDYISTAQKLKAHGCRVRFLDPAPDVWDSSDIADLLLASGPPPPLILPPDLSKLILPGVQNSQTVPQSHRTGANLKDNSTGAQYTVPAQLSGKSFRIIEAGEFGGTATGLRAISDSVAASEYVNEIINRPLIYRLVTGLGLLSGKIEAEEDVLGYYADAEHRREINRERIEQGIADRYARHADKETML